MITAPERVSSNSAQDYVVKEFDGHRPGRLLAPERHHRVHLCSTAGWEPGCEHCHRAHLLIRTHGNVALPALQSAMRHADPTLSMAATTLNEAIARKRP